MVFSTIFTLYLQHNRLCSFSTLTIEDPSHLHKNRLRVVKFSPNLTSFSSTLPFWICAAFHSPSPHSVSLIFCTPHSVNNNPALDFSSSLLTHRLVLSLVDLLHLYSSGLTTSLICSQHLGLQPPLQQLFLHTQPRSCNTSSVYFLFGAAPFPASDATLSSHFVVKLLLLVSSIPCSLILARTSPNHTLKIFISLLQFIYLDCTCRFCRSFVYLL